MQTLAHKTTALSFNNQHLSNLNKQFKKLKQCPEKLRCAPHLYQGSLNFCIHCKSQLRSRKGLKKAVKWMDSFHYKYEEDEELTVAKTKKPEATINNHTIFSLGYKI